MPCGAYLAGNDCAVFDVVAAVFGMFNKKVLYLRI